MAEIGAFPTAQLRVRLPADPLSRHPATAIGVGRVALATALESIPVRLAVVAAWARPAFAVLAQMEVDAPLASPPSAVVSIRTGSGLLT